MNQETKKQFCCDRHCVSLYSEEKCPKEDEFIKWVEIK